MLRGLAPRGLVLRCYLYLMVLFQTFFLNSPSHVVPTVWSDDFGKFISESLWIARAKGGTHKTQIIHESLKTYDDQHTGIPIINTCTGINSHADKV